MNEKIRYPHESQEDRDDIHQGSQEIRDDQEHHKLWIRIQRAIQNGEKEFFYDYPGIGEIKVTLTDS
jgi:hypothetical protein